MDVNASTELGWDLPTAAQLVDSLTRSERLSSSPIPASESGNVQGLAGPIRRPSRVVRVRFGLDTSGLFWV